MEGFRPYKPQVERSQFMETSQNEVMAVSRGSGRFGLKRTYLDMKHKESNPVPMSADLSNIGESRGQMIEEDASADMIEIPQASKRQHISGDPKEQTEAEKKKLLKLLDPILDEKMAGYLSI